MSSWTLQYCIQTQPRHQYTKLMQSHQPFGPKIIRTGSHQLLKIPKSLNTKQSVELYTAKKRPITYKNANGNEKAKRKFPNWESIYMMGVPVSWRCWNCNCRQHIALLLGKEGALLLTWSYFYSSLRPKGVSSLAPNRRKFQSFFVSESPSAKNQFISSMEDD